MKKIFILITLCIALMSLSMYAQKARKGKETPAHAFMWSEIEKTGYKKDATEKRGRYTKHFEMNDGSFKMYSSPGSIHYQTATGWEEIDLTIHSNTTGVHGSNPYFNGDNSFKTYYPQSPMSGRVYTKVKDGEMSERIEGLYATDANGNTVYQYQSNTPQSVEVNTNNISYTNLFPNTKVVYAQQADGRKFAIQLQSAQALSGLPVNAKFLVIKEKVTIPANWTVTQTEGYINLFSGSTWVANFLKPTAIEKNSADKNYDNEEDLMSEGTMRMTRIGNELTIYTQFSVEWLKAANRQFPVMLDPTTNYYPPSPVLPVTPTTSMVTGRLTSATSAKTSGFLRIAATGTFSWAKFNIASLPIGATVNTATYWGYHYSPNGVTADKIASVVGMQAVDPEVTVNTALSPLISNQININGPVYSTTYVFGGTNPTVPPYTWRSAALTGNASSDIAEQRSLQDWTALGFKYTSGNTGTMLQNGIEVTSTVPAQLPYLVLDYTFICNPVITNEDITRCGLYTWPANGQTYSTSGIYIKTTPQTGKPTCIDTTYLHLTVTNNISYSSSVTSCDSYVWGGLTYTTSGTFTHTFYPVAGCDSVHTLNLTINHSTSSSLIVSAIDSFVWVLNGITYTTSGTYTHTTTNAVGCDSIISLNLTILQPAVTVTFQNVIQISPSIFEYDVMLTNTGNTALALKGYSCGINHATGMRGGGTLTHTYLSRDPMLASIPTPAPGYTASTNHLRIIASNAANGNEVNLPPGLAVRLATMRVSNSVPFPADFIPDFTLQTLAAVGKTNCIATCIVTPPGTVYNINGIGNTVQAGNLQGLTGVVNTPCLYLHPTSTFVASAIQSSPVSCQGLSNGVGQIFLSGNGSGDTGTYVLDGGVNVPYTSNSFVINNLAAGTHTVTVTTSYGCTHTTSLTVTEPALINIASSVAACDSYTWEGITYTTTGTATHTYTSVAGCDSVHTKNFTIYYSYTGSTSVTACSSYGWNGTTYTASGVYTNSFMNANGCDSLITLYLVVSPIPVPVINTTGPLTFCDGDVVVLNANTGNGLNYQWYKNGFIINGATANSYTVTQSGSYTMEETNAGNCSSVSTPQVVTVNNCNVHLHLKLFIQGYYVGSSMMAPVLMNETVSADPIVTDSILIELHSPLPPYGLVLSRSAILHTDGLATCTFNYVNGNYYLADSYYVAVRHRNGLTTWSANPVNFTSLSVQYDFSSASSQAYGDNMLEVDPGVWAFFNGDLNADENIDLLDFPFMEIDINNFVYGYFNTDLNGDGNVDLLDISVLEPNVFNFIFSSQPVWSGTLPAVSTSPVSGINVGTAVCGGNVFSSGGANITAKGVCWRMNPNPTVADSKTTNGTGTGGFTSTLTNLFPNVTYYVRAYATSSVGTVYGNEVSFNTPIVNFSDSLSLSFNILGACSDGGNDATACTFATCIRPSLPSGSVVTGGNLVVTNLATLVYSWCSEVRFNLFGANLVGANLFSPGVVSPGAIETGSVNFTYARPISGSQMTTMLNTVPVGGTLRIGYWEDFNDVVGGSDISLNASGLTTTATLKIYYNNLPAVTTSTVSNLTNASALSGGYISNVSGVNITARGVCWSVNPNPTVSLNTKTNDGTGTGSFISNLTGLNPGTTYHVRAYATSSAGTVYGNDIVFTTLP